MRAYGLGMVSAGTDCAKRLGASLIVHPMSKLDQEGRNVMNVVNCKKGIGAAILTVGALGVLATSAPAQVTNINSVVIQARRYNDYAGSTLSIVNNYPSLVSFNEGPFGTGNWANHHNARFSTNGTTARSFLNAEAFDISVNVNLAVGSIGPRKEVGFRMDTFIGGEGQLMVASDGEVAAFGGPFPFYTFGNVYTAGTTARLRMIYRPGAVSTVEYRFNALTSGQLAFGNSENGVINGSDFGMYVQNQPNDNNPNDFSNASFTNFAVAVPEPMSMLALAAGVGVLLRKRRSNK